MVLIEVKKEDKEKVLEILLGNGKFRSLGENKFDIIDNPDKVLKRIREKKIDITVIENN